MPLECPGCKKKLSWRDNIHCPVTDQSYREELKDTKTKEKQKTAGPVLSCSKFEEKLGRIEFCIDGYYFGGKGGIEEVIEEVRVHNRNIMAQLATMKKEIERLRRCKHG